MSKLWGFCVHTNLKGTIPWAGLTIGVILGLFYYWFAVANRYVIFLYTHLGAGPFDKSTSSRYWMASLVAAGVVLSVYAFVGWCRVRLADVFYQTYHLPPWQHVWLLSALPVAIGVWLITTRCNYPTLPWRLAAQCIVVAWVGIALALWLAELIVHQTSQAFWVILHGGGLVPIMLLLRAVELPSRGWAASASAYLLATAGLAVGILWVGGAACLRAARREPPLNARSIFCAGLVLSYVVLPLVHYLLLTPPDARYITTAGNFFANTPTAQLACWGMSALVALLVTKRFGQKRRKSITTNGRQT